METIYERCCGLDVHKKSVWACLRVLESGQFRSEIREFATTTAALLKLGDWLRKESVTHVAMESTGVYWKPVWNLLEGQFELVLANAQHIKAVPGRKTDAKDCEWIAQLLQHGLLRSSFVPDQAQRDLRDLTHYRVQVIEERSREINRLEKFLEDANIKLTSVVTDVTGRSARTMLDAMIEGVRAPEILADMALGRLRSKIPLLKSALEGHIRPIHIFFIEETLLSIDQLTEKIARIECRIQELMRPFLEQAQRLMTIPGVSRATRDAVIAEIGVDMSRFRTPAHLASWAGICPGNNESAGKRHSGRTTFGNKWLKRVLVQAAWAAARVKTSYLSAQFRRLARRRGAKKAALGVAHSILCSIWHMLKNGVDYRDLGADYFDKTQSKATASRLKKRLENLGFEVQLTPRPAATP